MERFAQTQPTMCKTFHNTDSPSLIVAHLPMRFDNTLLYHSLKGFVHELHTVLTSYKLVWNLIA